jgi:hypothetical protein
MTDADAKLKALLRAAEPEPAMDPRFRLAVIERIERRQARVKLALVFAAGSAGVAALALLGPQLTQGLGQTALVAASLGIAGAAMVWSARLLHRPI